MSEFLDDRRYLHGQMPWGPESQPDHDWLSRATEGPEIIEFDGPLVIPVFARPVSNIAPGKEDRTAQIVFGDVPEPLSAFDATQALYDGVDTRGTPTFDWHDDDPSKLL